MYSIPPADEPASFQEILLTVVRDPQIRKLALRLAGDSDLAEDVLQEAYYGVSRVRNPEQIEDLRAYFCRALINTTHRLQGKLREAALVEDFERLAEVRQGNPGPNPIPPTSVEDTVSMSMACQAWLERFAAQRADLRKAVPGRSDDADRYRDVIVAVAERVLRTIVHMDVSQADANQALRARYPEWFGSEACAVGNAHQRFSRARADIRELFRFIIGRDEL